MEQPESRLQKAQRLEREGEMWLDRALIWLAGQKYTLAMVLLVCGFVLWSMFRILR